MYICMSDQEFENIYTVYRLGHIHVVITQKRKKRL